MILIQCVLFQTDIAVPVNFKSHVKKPFVTAKGSMMEEVQTEPQPQQPLKFALMTKRGKVGKYCNLQGENNFRSIKNVSVAQ